MAFFGISVVTLLVFLISLALEGVFAGPERGLVERLTSLGPDVTFEVLTNAAELLAAVLAIAITVVAIVVELAANRYSHRITTMFVREPVNIFVMSFFVVATIHSIWNSLFVGGDSTQAVIANAGLLISMAMVTISLTLLLPYFAFVLSFLSPDSVIEKIKGAAVRRFDSVGNDDNEPTKNYMLNRVDELQDIARRASETGDRAVAMKSINALCELLTDYQEHIPNLPKNWFLVSPCVARDPDFVSLSDSSISEIEKSGTWLDVKVMRQYLSLVSIGSSSSRDMTNLIAINTNRIGSAAATTRTAVVELCIRCFNSYLRATINKNDQRTCYYIMNQYRQMAEELLRSGQENAVREIALHFQFYGQLGFTLNMPFLLEVAAYDIGRLIEDAARQKSTQVDDLLDLILELDREIKKESDEVSLLGIRRAQIQLAAFFLDRGDESRARRIANDLMVEKPERVKQVREMLMSEERPHYWEITDRGINFSYLDPQLRRHVDTVLDWARSRD
ncbi:MAG: DUF2254 domain-containing protein [Gammaproteobacteria bacterium]|nr:DUF2254 domain-containing protein [Gammaproteobacteria bacterium]